MDVDELDNNEDDKTKMATLMKAIHISKATINNVTKLFSSISLSPSHNLASNIIYLKRISTRLPAIQTVFIHTTPMQNDLMEFFDHEDNWEKNAIRGGRAWKAEELRRKSNEDLHKLWYVLLKERNMLLTMDEIYKDDNLQMPSPERVDKVKISMDNIEKVVRERNKAYFMLETGTSGERPGKVVYNPLGLKTYHCMRQYSIPKYMNTKWAQKFRFGFGGYATSKFLRLYREKLWAARRKERNRQCNQALTTMRIFPNVDLEALAEKYPQADIKKLRTMRKADNHAVSK